ncbi:MAG TPA: DsrE family protein [Noviherbaspirillum sp.]|uniref:DsrE family protein n=1 Tax=Noviherbaspirillum sp. TaxID=1926288 RepID=UPI002B47BD0F|nr:DsrE family protein [Noviherbaspirillum sp.]HJV87175.1 DsrE family protein [Noviherbaspirillum sp.]
MKRTLLKIFLATMLGLLVSSGVSAEERIKVVYHIVDGLDQAARALANIRNHLRAEPGVQIVVVANGNGIKFLLKGAQDRDGKPFDAAVRALAEQGVEFRACRNTMTAHEIPESDLLPEAKLVPSGVAEVARLQAREGFVYLRP